MGAKPRKSKKQSNTNDEYKRQLKRTTFFLDRSLIGKLIPEELRKHGVKVEPHSIWFRHNTPDENWLAVVGEKKWVVLTGDINIGRRPLELDALLTAKVKAFVIAKPQVLTALQQAQLIIKALPQILEMLQEYRIPFLAKIHDDGSVALWRTDVQYEPSQSRKKRYRPPKGYEYKRKHFRR